MDGWDEPISVVARVVALMFLLSVSAAVGGGDNCVWDNTTGNWNDGSKWSCGHEPGVADTAVVGGGTVTLTASASVAVFTFSGSLDGAGDLEVTSQMTWTAGPLGGTGKITIGESATLTLPLPFTNRSMNRNLDNAGVATITSSLSPSSGVLTNLSTGTLDFASDLSFSAAVTNHGTLVKSAGGGNSSIGAQFTQSSGGSTDIQTGALVLGAGGSIDGTMSAVGTTLQLQGGDFTFLASAAITATNLVAIGGSVTFDLGGAGYAVTTTTIQSVVAFDGPAVNLPNLNLGPFSGNSLLGSADITITGQMTWSGGIQGGTGKTTIQEGAELTISGGGSNTLNRQLDNAGQATVTGGLSPGTGLFTNLSSATLDFAADLSFSAAVTNHGTLVKSAGGTNTILGGEVTQSSEGSTDIQSGALSLRANGSIDGEVTGNGTALRFDEGTFSTDGAVIDVGALWVTNSIVDLSGAASLTIGDFIQAGGTATLDHPEVTILGTFLRTAIGSTFIPGKGRILFAGGVEQDLTLQRPTEFFYLEVSPGTTLIETEAIDHATVTGFLRNRGTIRKTQPIAGPGTVSFGLTDMELNVTDAGSMTEMQVDRIWGNHPNSAPPTMPDFYWQLTPTGGGATADVTLYHCYQPDTEALLCRWTGASWDCGNDFSTQISITRQGMSEFGDWSAGAVDPLTFMTGFECGNVSAVTDVLGLC